jgi:hypothetical protein
VRALISNLIIEMTSVVCNRLVILGPTVGLNVKATYIYSRAAGGADALQMYGTTTTLTLGETFFALLTVVRIT